MNRFSEMRVIREHLVLSSYGLCSQGDRLWGRSREEQGFVLLLFLLSNNPERD